MPKINSFIFLLLIFFTTSSFANEINFTTHYQSLLSKYVKQATKQGIKVALVNYQAWGKDSLHQKTLDQLQKINLSNLNNKKKIAFWINAYNFLTIDLIIKTGEKQNIKNQGSFFKNVWKSHHWLINDKKYSLDQIEHDILRPMGDAKVHMAIVCASLSCPDLNQRVYDEKNLNQQLEDQSLAFLNNPTKGVIISEKGLKISKIFAWFDEDFGGEQGVLDFIHQYLPHTKNNNKISDYFDYNWSLNSF